MRNANCKLTLKCIFSVQFIRVLPSSIPFYEDFACFLFRIIEWICDLCRSGSEYRFVAVHCTSNKLYPLHRIKCPFQCNKITRMCVTCAASDVALRREQNPITLMKRTPKRTRKKANKCARDNIAAIHWENMNFYDAVCLQQMWAETLDRQIYYIRLYIFCIWCRNRHNRHVVIYEPLARNQHEYDTTN